MSQDGTAPDVAWWHPAPGETVDWLAWANALPYCRNLGLECASELNEGSATFRMECSTLTPNPNGAVNGGTVTAAADQIMGAVTMRMSDERTPARDRLSTHPIPLTGLGTVNFSRDRAGWRPANQVRRGGGGGPQGQPLRHQPGHDDRRRLGGTTVADLLMRR